MNPGKPVHAVEGSATDTRLEGLSSLVDGELDAREAGELISALCSDEQLRAQWTAYHAVGDALRSSEVASTHSAEFCRRVWAAVEQEPAILAPRNLQRRSPLRRYLTPGLAVAASVAVIGFMAVPLMRPDAPAPVASAPTVPLAQPAATIVPPAPEVAAAGDPDARRTVATAQRMRPLEAYLVAHRELTGGAALPRATPYLRTAGDQPEGR